MADEVLADWALAPDEWRAFTRLDARFRIEQVIAVALFCAFLGGVAGGTISGGWAGATIPAAVVGAFVMSIGLLRLARLRNRVPRRGGVVVIREDRVEIDGEIHTLADDEHWLSHVSVRRDLPLPVLEVTLGYSYHDRKGTRRVGHDVLRIPVPRVREREAAEVAENLRRGGRVLAAASDPRLPAPRARREENAPGLG